MDNSSLKIKFLLNAQRQQTNAKQKRDTLEMPNIQSIPINQSTNERWYDHIVKKEISQVKFNK